LRSRRNASDYSIGPGSGSDPWLPRGADLQVAHLPNDVTKRPILVIASGPNRVNEAMLAAIVGEPIERTDADFVRARTGFAIGGVPPVGHSEPIETYLDQSLLAEASLWAAGGTPLAVFQLTPAVLREITRGRVIAIT
jgi:prolyl-tRNA editing enzyme YbaK/EbsC (Cys-tRNA(Pro) deacylase)